MKNSFNKVVITVRNLCILLVLVWIGSIMIWDIARPMLYRVVRVVICFAGIDLLPKKPKLPLELSFDITPLGILTTTSYRSVKNQTDSTPFYTATGVHVEPGGVAVSRDLLCGACRKLHGRCRHPEYDRKLHYGDWLYIDGYGFRYINDIMGEYSTTKHNGKRYKRKIINQIDIWVGSYKEERAVKIKKLKIYKLKEVK